MQEASSCNQLLLERAKRYLQLNRPHFALGELHTCLSQLSSAEQKQQQAGSNDKTEIIIRMYYYKACTYPLAHRQIKV